MTGTPPLRFRRRKTAAPIAAALAFFVAAFAFAAGEVETIRVRRAAKIFRVLVQTDLDLAAKRTPAGEIVVVVLHEGGTDLAEVAKEAIPGQTGTVRDFPLRVEIVRGTDPGERPVSFVFLASEFTGENVEKLARLAVSRKILVFSPYAHHVELGVPAGVIHDPQGKLYLNRGVLERAGIRLPADVYKSAKLAGGAP